MIKRLLLFALLGACVPQPPNDLVVKSTERLSDGFYIHHLNNDRRIVDSKNREVRRVSEPKGRNAVFVALDDETQDAFQSDLLKLYPRRPEIRIESVAWWIAAQRFHGLYDDIIRLRYDQVAKETLVEALKTAESLGKPYDLFLMTHGFPNQITMSDPDQPFRWKDLQKLKGQLQNLQVVFLQQCWGQSLAQDWHEAGARAVLSYRSLQKNFIFFDQFLRYFRAQPERPRLAYEEATRSMLLNYRRDPVYRKILQAVWPRYNEYRGQALKLPPLSFEEFLASLEVPEFQDWP